MTPFLLLVALIRFGRGLGGRSRSRGIAGRALPVEVVARLVLAGDGAIGADLLAIAAADDGVAGPAHVVLPGQRALDDLALSRQRLPDRPFHGIDHALVDRRQAAPIVIAGALGRVGRRRAIEPALAAVVGADLGEADHIVALPGHLDLVDTALLRQLGADRILHPVLLPRHRPPRHRERAAQITRNPFHLFPFRCARRGRLPCRNFPLSPIRATPRRIAGNRAERGRLVWRSLEEDAMLGNRNAVANLAVRNLDRARAFYTGTLGLKEVDHEGDELIVLESGDSKVNVYRSDYAGTNEATAVTWAVADIEGEVESLKRNGLRFEPYDLPALALEGVVHVGEDMKVAWFKDPDGNILNIVGN